MKVTEIFNSLQGEGVNSGVPMTFIRLSDCNLRCSYCDTKYAFDEGRDVSLDDLYERLDHTWVCITGGEPLLQDLDSLVAELKERRHKIEIETNGSLPPPEWAYLVDTWVVDSKCPSSNMKSVAISEWCRVAHCEKYVVSTPEDLAAVQHNSVGPTIVSPMAHSEGFYIPWCRTVWEFCVVHNYRFSMQLHKIVFGNSKGV